MKKKLTLVFLLLFGAAANLFAQDYPPLVTSWLLNTTGLTGYQGLPANVQQIQYSENNVYVSCSGIPAYTIGPWAGNPNTPSNQNWVFKFTQKPVQNLGAPIETPLGNIGTLINGVPIFNAKDAMSYNNKNVWHQNAVVVEAPGFDACLGHAAPGGTPGNPDPLHGIYHHHQFPKCLNTPDSKAHSPIVGYAFDGYPIYGPYAHENRNGTGNIILMRPSYVARSITERTSLPDGTQLSSDEYGPAVSTQYPLGYYIEDYHFIQDQGDLDEHNGRFCVTPEFPSGTYAYFMTIDNAGNSVYPYTVGPSYYGLVPPGTIGPGSGHAVVDEDVATYTPSSTVREDPEASSVKIFPNPTHKFLDIDFLREAAYSIVLIDTKGTEVKRWHLRTSHAHLDLSGLAKGAYSLLIESSSGKIERSIVIE